MFEKALNSDVDFVFRFRGRCSTRRQSYSSKKCKLALQDLDWQGNGKTVSVRINSIDTHYMYRDVIEV